MRGERIDQERGGTGTRVMAGLVWAVLLLAIDAAPAEARVVGATLPVRGMTCALCTKSVEESVKGLGGVRVTADLSRGLVSVEAIDGHSLGLRDVKDRILAAGFKIGGEPEVKAIGRFILTNDSRITFRVNGGSSYQVLENDTLRRMFRHSSRLAGEYEITFRLHEHPEWRPSGIALSRFEERRPPAPASAAVTPPPAGATPAPAPSKPASIP